jgi:hypothetical protein
VALPAVWGALPTCSGKEVIEDTDFFVAVRQASR